MHDDASASANLWRTAFDRIRPEMIEALPGLVDQTMGDRLRGFVEARDIAHEVWMRFETGLSEFVPRDRDAETSLRRLLSTIIRNTVIDTVRKHEVRIGAIERLIFEHADQEGITPSRAVAQKQALQTLSECLIRLEAIDRSIILLRVCDGATVKSIADQFSLTTAQVDHRIRKIILQLRQMMGDSSDYRFAFA